jgi:LmbE family N-acetylglucosaminyl deacetylase
MNRLSLVAVGAHPDDIELSMSGLLLRFAGAGHDVTWIVATDGAAGNGGRDTRLAAMRATEAQAAATSAGARLVQCDFPDGQLAWNPRAPAMIGQHLGQLRPDLIVTHALNDYHADHRAVARIVGDTAPVSVPILRADNMLGLYFSPDILVDIGDVFEKKLAVLAMHKSQKMPEFREGVTTWNRFRGLQSSKAKFAHAEAYSIDRQLNNEVRLLLDSIGGYVML